jgi:rhodanese-related sulfurtransferase
MVESTRLINIKNRETLKQMGYTNVAHLDGGISRGKMPVRYND